MIKLKRIAAALTAVAMSCAIMTGCTDTSYVMTAGDDKVNAGVYIYNMLSEMSNQMMKMQYIDGITKDFFDQKVDNKSFSDYLSEYAESSTKEYMAVVDQFDKLGLELTADELKEINKNVSDQWENSSEFFESEGISKDSVKLVYKAAKMREKIFDYFYEEGGKEEVKKEDIVSYLNENYVRYKMISISKSTDEDKDKAEKADKESKAKRDKYLEKAENVSFDEFDKIIDEYNNESKAESESSSDSSSSADESSSAAESSSESSADSTESSQADSSAEDTSSAASDDTSSQAETTESGSDDSLAEIDESSSEADSSTADSSADSSSESDESKDPYENEQFVNYGKMDDDKKKTDSGKLAEHVHSMKVGKAETYEDDNAYYILIKGNVKDRSSEYAEENRSDMLQKMKGDDFKAKLTKWVEALKIQENSKAISRYTPKVVYDKQEKYQSENNNNNQ